MISDEKREEIVMTMIANAGSARGHAFGAIKAAREGDFAGAEEALRQATESLRKVQEVHRNLLQMYAQGELPGIDLLLCHAQDHFMMASLARDLAAELVHVYRQIREECRRESA
ncbi:MAG: PTS lactose/cellobiose transporter subunit IIA [Bacillota bacterium]|nr:MAG: PTS cellobiose transporter subunit IIA [Bacillota bacterium]